MKINWAARPLTLLATFALVFSTFAGAASAATPLGDGVFRQDNAIGTKPDECEKDEWHWVINGFTGGSATSPATIQVTWVGGATQDAPRTTDNDRQAGYTIAAEDALGSEVDYLHTTAVMPANWTGNFVLSHSPCGDTATITIDPDGVNNVGDAHEFTITVKGTAALSGLAITWNVSPEADTMESNCDSPAMNLAGDSAECTLTINNGTVGSFEASASATGTVGTTAFDITTGTGVDSGAANKDYVCMTHDLTLRLTEAGKSQPAFDSFQSGDWVVTFWYDDGSGWQSVTTDASDFSGTTAGDPTNEISKTVTIGTDEPYTASVSWYFTIDPGVFDSRGDDLDNPFYQGPLSVPNTGDCSVSDFAISPKSDITLYKIEDADGNGDIFDDLDFLLYPLEDWTLTATSGETSISGTTGEDGSVQLIGLDDLVAWTICETPDPGDTTDGYLQTVPAGSEANPGCYEIAALGLPTGGHEGGPSYYFGNAKPSAEMTITPAAVNEVGTDHTVRFTITKTAGRTAASEPAGGVDVSYTLSGANDDEGSCTTNDEGWCEVTFSSDSAGVTTVSASASVTVTGVAGSVDVPVSGETTKTWVDASISIGPSAVNFIGQEHTFTITVTANASGEETSFDSITVSVDPTPDLLSTNDCDDPTVDGDTATCTLTINSSVPGDFVANASATITMGGVTVTRSTDGNYGPDGSGPATKTYVCNYCSPGYWKTHGYRWDHSNALFNKKDGTDYVTAYQTTTLFEAVFGAGSATGLTFDYGSGKGAYKGHTASATVTLLDVLNMNGGGKTALARAAVAALLNASATGMTVPSDIDTAAEVIAIFTGATAPYEDEIATLTQGSGSGEICPLN